MSQRSVAGWHPLIALAQILKSSIYCDVIYNKYTRALTFTEFLPIYEGTDIYGFPPGDRELLSRRKQLKPVITFD